MGLGRWEAGWESITGRTGIRPLPLVPLQALQLSNTWAAVSTLRSPVYSPPALHAFSLWVPPSFSWLAHQPHFLCCGA